MDDQTGLTVQSDEAVILSQNGGIDQAIRPLKKEIYLFDTYVAGVSYLDDPSVLSDIKPGDRLTLRREDNKFDDKAILILKEDGRKIGYVPRKDNAVFSRLMDAGKYLTAYVKESHKRSIDFQQIRIGIYLVDF